LLDPEGVVSQILVSFAQIAGRYGGISQKTPKADVGENSHVLPSCINYTEPEVVTQIDSPKRLSVVGTVPVVGMKKGPGAISIALGEKAIDIPAP
jgi:hypothetical protein